MPVQNLSNMHSPRSWHDCHKIMTEWRESESGKRAYSWGADEAPLDGRRKRHLALKLVHDNTYTLVLYDTGMVAYEQGGAVHVQTPHSRTGVEFLKRTLPQGVRYEGAGRDAWLCIDTAYGPRYAKPLSSSTMLTPQGGFGRWGVGGGVKRRIRATLAFRHIPALEKRIAELVSWRAATLRLGLDPDPRPPWRGDDRAAVLAAIDTPSMWPEVFWQWPPEYLLGVCAQATGAIQFVTEELSPEKFKSPPAHWAARIPQLKYAHEVKFV